MPKITFTSAVPAQRGKGRGFAITGVKDDGTAYNGFMWGNSPLAGKLRSLTPGSYVNLKMQQNDKGFWDIVDIEVLGGGAPAAAPTLPEQDGGFPGPLPTPRTPAAPAVHGHSTYRDPDDTNRSAALMAAKDIVLALMEAKAFGAKPTEELVKAKLFDMSQFTLKLIKGELKDTYVPVSQSIPSLADGPDILGGEDMPSE